MSFQFKVDVGGVSGDIINNAEKAIGLGWVTDLLARKGSMTALAEAHPLTQAYAREHKAELKNMLGLEQMEPKLRTLLQAMLAAHKATLAAKAAAKAAAEAEAEQASPALVLVGEEEAKKEPTEESKAAAEAAETSAVADQKLLAAHFDLSSVPILEIDSAVKDMLVAVLNEDKSAFKKAFALFESEQCKEDPNNYVKGLGNADDAYDNLYDDLFKLEAYPGLVEKLTNSSFSDDDFPTSLNFVAGNVKMTLDEQNEVNPSVEKIESDSEDSKAKAEKLNAENSKRAAAFVNKAMQDEFEAVKAERKQAQANLKAAKKAQTTAVLESTDGKFNYAIAYVKSIFVTLDEVAKKSEVTTAEMHLKTAQKNLDTAKAARGWVFGFYLTPDFKGLIGKKFAGSLSTETQLLNALGCTQEKEVPGMSTLDSIASSFVGAFSAVKSFPGKVGRFFATAWESLKGSSKAEPGSGDGGSDFQGGGAEKSESFAKYGDVDEASASAPGAAEGDGVKSEGGDNDDESSSSADEASASGSSDEEAGEELATDLFSKAGGLQGGGAAGGGGSYGY